MKKLIAFLGNPEYTPYHYKYGDNETRSKTYSTKAIEELIFKEEVKKYFILTQNLEEKQHRFISENYNGSLFETRTLPGLNDMHWGIFEAILDMLEEGDEINMDATHGFRSIPMIAILCFLFIRSRRQTVGI